MIFDVLVAILSLLWLYGVDFVNRAKDLVPMLEDDREPPPPEHGVTATRPPMLYTIYKGLSRKNPFYRCRRGDSNSHGFPGGVRGRKEPRAPTDPMGKNTEYRNFTPWGRFI